MVSPLQQKIRVSGPVIITANRLSDGAVVYRTASGGWDADLGKAEVLTAVEDVQKALQAAQTDILEAVGPYIAPVDASENSARPGNIRELIRKSGPTFALPSDNDVAYPSQAKAAKSAA